MQAGVFMRKLVLNFKMKGMKNALIFIFLLALSACKVENLKPTQDIPKVDFSTYNYVLATEDASSEDITTFFAFNRSDIDSEKQYDLIQEDQLFINSNPSVSSGHCAMNQYFFSFTKDKKGYSSTPGLYRLTLNDKNRVYINDNLSISKNNLFPARQLCIVNDVLGYFYDEGKEAYKIQIFNPTTMTLKGSMDLKPAIEAFRPNIKWVDESGNNLVRTGSLVLEYKQGKLYVSIVFLETASFNLIANSEQNFYVAVIDVFSNEVEKIISYHGAKTVGFFVSENKATTKDENDNLYFCSWGWNQFNEGNPSKVFRIKQGETDFDTDWVIDIESLFGAKRTAQSMIAYNNKIYLHISNAPYGFSDSDGSSGAITMSYYEINPSAPEIAHKLDIPISNPSPRMNVFSIVDDKLFIAVPNVEKDKFNGFFSIDKSGMIKKEISIENKYRPTRLYKLNN